MTGVALAGVGTGVAVYVSRTKRPERQRDLLREALRIGLLVSLPIALVVPLAGWMWEERLSGSKLGPALFATAAVAGWIAVIPGVVNGFWLGLQQRGRMLALAAGSAGVSLATVFVLPAEHVLAGLAIAQAAPAAVVLFFFSPGVGRPRFRKHSHPLRRYVLPGLSIGILSPLSLLVARSVVGEALSWHEAGVLQSLWRLSDWVCAFAAGILSVHYLPRFAAARSAAQLTGALREAAKPVLLVSAAVFVILFLFHRPLIGMLYDPGFVVSPLAVALVFAGSLVRIASWVALFALYALRRTRAITIGEVLSLPLFAALLLFAGNGLSLEKAGAAWLASFAVYCAFNFWALRRPQ